MENIHNQGNGFYKKFIDDIEYTIISDGKLYNPDGMFAQEATEEEVLKQIKLSGLEAQGNSVQVNALAIQKGNDLTLVDTGTNIAVADTVGQFLSNFNKSGFKVEEVNRVVLTHLHFDHFGYLFDANGKPTFPNAEIILSETEYNFWNDNNPNLKNLGADKATKDFFISSAKEVIKFMGKNYTLKNPGDEVAPGLRILAAPGHTPGHIALESEGFIYIADTVIHEWLHLTHPEWTSVVDADPESARTSRKYILDKASTDNLFVAGTHLNFPSFGKMKQADQGYSWQPTPFTW